MFLHNKTCNRILNDMLRNNHQAKEVFFAFCNKLPDSVKKKIAMGNFDFYSDGLCAMTLKYKHNHFELQIKYGDEHLAIDFQLINKNEIENIPLDPKNEIFVDPDYAQPSPAGCFIAYSYPQKRGNITVYYDFFVLKKSEDGFYLVSQETIDEDGFISTRGFYSTPIDVNEFVVKEKIDCQTQKHGKKVTL